MSMAWLGTGKISEAGTEGEGDGGPKASRDHEDEDADERAALRQRSGKPCAAEPKRGGGAIDTAWEEAEAAAAVQEGRRAAKRARREAAAAPLPAVATRHDRLAGLGKLRVGSEVHVTPKATGGLQCHSPASMRACHSAF